MSKESLNSFNVDILLPPNKYFSIYCYTTWSELQVKVLNKILCILKWISHLKKYFIYDKISIKFSFPN